MYGDLNKVYWWDGSKKDIVEFVAKCRNCQQVKAEHLKNAWSNSSSGCSYLEVGGN